MRKKLSIALLAFSLAMICANFIVRRVGKLFPPPLQEVEEEGEVFSPFAMTKQKQDTEIVIDSTSLVLKGREETHKQPIQEKEIVKPILKFELTKEEEQIIETYSQNPKLKAFIEEISAVISDEELRQENYLQVAYKPEVRDIFMKYSQDEEFRKIASEIMKNKDLLELAKNTFNKNEVKK